jgi:hypothetical protein
MDSLVICIALAEFAGGSGRDRLVRATTNLCQLAARHETIFLEAYPMWNFCKFVSCACGMKNRGTVEPWENMQGFLSNASLAEMHRHVCAP